MQLINKRLNKKAVENMEAMEIKNGIKRIDKGMTSSSAGITQDKDD